MNSSEARAKMLTKGIPTASRKANHANEGVHVVKTTIFKFGGVIVCFL